MEEEEVRHNEEELRFEVGNSIHILSTMDYRRQDGQLIITHTFVPPERRGQGIAERLVRTALAFARKEKLAVVPRCAYVETFLRRHPEFADLLSE